MHAHVTDTPAALTGTEAGETYFLRNRGPDVILVEVAEAAPVRGSRNATPVDTFQEGHHTRCDIYPTPEDDESVFVWTQRRNGAASVVYEVS